MCKRFRRYFKRNFREIVSVLLNVLFIFNSFSPFISYVQAISETPESSTSVQAEAIVSDEDPIVTEFTEIDQEIEELDPVDIDIEPIELDEVQEETIATEESLSDFDTQVCLTDGESTVSSVDADWNVDGDRAQTKDSVKLGVEYIYPLNHDVSVIFTCLPKDEDLRDKLEITQVKVSEIKLPEDYSTDSEYAFDIDTDMEKGTFEYDLVLPGSELSETAEIVYIEKDISDVTANRVDDSELKTLKNEKKDGEKIRVEGLDHFTIFIPTIDVDGANDEPGQKDLTKFGFEQIGPKLYEAFFSWDDDSTTNTIDACILLNTDGDTGVNYAVCPSYNSADVTKLRLFSCSDRLDKPSNCWEAALLPTVNSVFTTNTTCSVSITNDDPFLTGSDNPEDLTTHCTLEFQDSFTDEVKVKNVCTYPSGSPTSDASDCLAFEEGGFLQIVKVADPDDATVFSFDISDGDGFLQNVGIEGSGQSGLISLDSGVYSILEDVPNGWGLDSATCDGGTPSQVNDGVDGLDIVSGSTIVCTFTNSLANGTLTVVKAVTNDDGGEAVASDFPLFIGATQVTNGVENELAAGDYVVSETKAGGYNATFSGACDSNGNVTLSANESLVCTITNDDIAPSLTVTKIVTNNNGGTAVVADFPLFVDDLEVVSGASNEFLAGSYTVSEDNLPGYAATYGGACDSDGNVTLTLGQEATCTITNTDVPASLTVIKEVIIDNGGTAVASDFNLYVNGGLVINGEANNFAAGTYTVSEDNLPGYAATYSGACDSEGSVTLVLGQEATCTITNNDIAPKLTVTKVVVNNNGGSAEIVNFNLYVGDTQVASGEQNSFSAGAYIVYEDNLDGYTATFSGDCDGRGGITLELGDAKTCTITNDDQGATLTVIKLVDNSNGGNLGSSDFTINVDGINVSDSSFSGSESGTQVTLDAGSFSVSEVLVDGYSPSYSEDCAGTIALGESLVCTITNGDVAPSLTVIKIVVNDNGGATLASDFQLYVGDIPVENGAINFFGSNHEYTLSEDNVFGYEAGVWEGDCAEDGTITLLPGDDKTCYITNDDVQPLLTVTKEVEGSDASIEEFPLYVGDTAVVSGIQNGFDAETYLVTETNSDGYTATFSEDCDVNGSITLSVGDVKNCIITNTRDTGNLRVLKEFDNDANGVFESDSDDANTLGFRWGLDDESPTRQFNTGINNLGTGDYTISENIDSVSNYKFVGYVLGRGGSCEDYTPSHLPADTSVLADETTVITLCNVIITGDLTVNKLYDSNGDGEYDTFNDGANDLGFRWGFDGEEINNTFGTTLSLPIGEYFVTEDNADFDEYELVAYSLNGSCTQSEETFRAELPISIVLNQFHPKEITLCNQRLTSGISGYKWNDSNANGEIDEGEDYLSGWTIFIDENDNQTLDEGETFTTTSDGEDFGMYSFRNLVFGTYTVCEVLQDGWLQSYPAEPTCHTVELPYTVERGVSEELLRPDFNFGNYVADPVLNIEKLNNTGGADRNSGDNVLYTIIVTNLENPAYNVTVTDLLPDGFTYNLGSWTANSTVRGDLKLGGVTTEPTYASPGTWVLGDLLAGEIVTLTYTGKVGGVDAGLYKDLAYALGENSIGSSILALAQPTGYVDDNFVGTEVNVVNEQGTEDKAKVDVNEVTEEVLGTSTERLPATGAETTLLYIALAGLGMGLIFMLTTLLKRNKKIALFILSLVAFTGITHAASLVVQIETPDSTANSAFDITYVSLDVQDREVVAKCMVKKPSDASFSQFGSDQNLGNGGDSGICAVGGGVLGAEGTYTFRVDVSAGGDNASSDEVGVDYNSSAPERPKYIKKDKQNSCEYDIEIKTHSNGSTSYVEVYRSDNKEFTVGDGSRIRTIVVGPDQKVEFTDNLAGPDCNNNQYYATRAFNAFGNASDVRTEEIDDVTTVTVDSESSTESDNFEAIGVGGGSILGDDSSDQAGDQGQQDNTSDTGSDNSTSDAGSVLGEGSARNVWLWIILALLGIVGFGAYSRRKKN